MTFIEIKIQRLHLQAQMTKIQVAMGKLRDECPHNWKPWTHEEGVDVKVCDACDHSEQVPCTSSISCFEGRKDL